MVVVDRTTLLDHHINGDTGLGDCLENCFARQCQFLDTVAPVLKKAGKALAKEALTTGVGVAGDVLAGESLEDSTRHRLSSAKNRLATKGARALQRMSNDSPPRKKVKRSRGKTIRSRDIFNKYPAIVCATDLY